MILNNIYAAETNFCRIFYMMFADFLISVGVFFVIEYSTFLKYDEELNPVLLQICSMDSDVDERSEIAFSHAMRCRASLGVSPAYCLK